MQFGKVEVNRKSFSENLVSLGFSVGCSNRVEEMLFMSPDWKNQFKTGETLEQLPRENKTTIAPSLPGFDIDDRPGKQPGNQGKQKKQSSQVIVPMVLPTGNPQPGPRSRSDLKGLAAF